MTTVPASVEACFDVGIDLEAYPQWAEGISSVEIRERDASGRPVKAWFEASGIGRQSAYVLAYDLSEAPGRLAWTMVESDLMRRLEGTYLFEPAPGSAEGAEETDVTYELIVDLAVPLPGFVKRRAEDKILAAALQRFKDRVVAVSAERQPLQAGNDDSA
jgi:hypothetical protein